MLGNTEATLSAAVKQGVVVVRSSRVGSGFVMNYQPYRGMGLFEANSLNPQRSRILLQLALTKTSAPKVIQKMFNKS